MSSQFYPSQVDLYYFLQSNGIESTLEQRALAIRQAISKWEGMTQRPFLVEDVDSTCLYDVESGKVEIPAYSSITSITTEIEYDGTTGEPGPGVVVIRNVDCFYSGSPIRSLRFRRPLRCGIQSVQIVGKRGVVTELTDEVFSAILKSAAADVFGNARNAATNGLKSINIGSGDLAVTFASLSETVAGEWSSAMQSAADNPNYRMFAL